MLSMLDEYAIKTLGIDGYLYQHAKATLTYGGKGSESRSGNHSVEDQREDLLVGDTMKDSDKSADKGSDNTDEMANVSGTLGAANILASGGLRKVTHGDASWGMAEVLTMFSLSCPASKLGKVGKASPYLASLVGNAVSSALGKGTLD
nr:hypothetical protein [Tanacetum cinerariifolium]